MTPIRRRIVIGMAVGAALAAGLASLGAWLVVRAHLVRGAEEAIRVDAGLLLARLRCGADPSTCLVLSQSALGIDGRWMVIDGAGTVMLSSDDAAAAIAGLGDGVACPPDLGMVRIGRRSGEVPGIDGTVTVVIARDEACLRATLVAVAWALAGAALAASLLAAAAARLVARSVMAPIDRIVSAIADARPDDARIRVDAAEIPAELRGIVDRADRFLDATRASLQRERRTSANIAHELRTPLAGLAATIDLALARERPAEGYRQALLRSREVVDETTRIIERLLLLTRIEAGREPVDRQRIAVAPILREVLAAAAAAAAARGIRLPAIPEGACGGWGDPGHLRLVLGNLVGNAVAHAPPGSSLSLEVDAGAADCSIRIVNPVTGLRAEDVPALGEPFWRGDDARGGTGRHAGLGLALCQRLCALDGWQLAYAVEAGAFRVDLRLPGVAS